MYGHGAATANTGLADAVDLTTTLGHCHAAGTSCICEADGGFVAAVATLAEIHTVARTCKTDVSKMLIAALSKGHRIAVSLDHSERLMSATHL